MPKVSVIVPVYGVEKYIERCARSLFEQTLDDIEYMFVDDCTPDRSIEILKQVLVEYPQRKPQVVIHRMEHNSGQAVVRKWGIQNANGEYVIHCDSDDWVDSDMYRAMYRKAKEDNADIVVCDFVLSNGIKALKREKGLISKQYFLSDMMYSKISWSLCNKLIRRHLYKEGVIYPNYNVGEDMALCLQVSAKANDVSYIKESYYFYYLNPSSIMNDNNTEKTVKRFHEMCSNVDIVSAVFKNTKVHFKVEWRLNAIKLYAKDLLLPVINKDSKQEWDNKYSEISLFTFINPSVRFRYKAIFILYKLGLYGFLKQFR